MKLSSVKYLVGIIVVGSLGFGAVQAGAQPPCNVVKLQRWYLSGCFWPCGTQYCQQCHDGNLFAAVIVNVDECVSRVNIFSDSGTANASSPAIWHTSIPEYLEVFIGEGDFPYSGSPTLPAVGNMGFLTPQTQLLPVTRVAGHVGGNVTGISAGKVYRLDVDGSLGMLQMDESPGTGFPQIHAGSTLSGFGNGITCDLGTIRRVDVTGDALAPISAPGGASRTSWPVISAGP